MKTITKKYKVYSYDELSDDAKAMALKEYNQNGNDMPFLQDDLREYIHEELQNAKIKELTGITPLYSLGYSQGDGLMFEGQVEDKKGNVYTIKHAGHYYHERSTSITGEDKKGYEIDTDNFNENVYIPICKSVARRGYDEIEYNESAENFEGMCEANEWVFLESGSMFNV